MKIGPQKHKNDYRTRAIITRSWILTIHKARILWKKPLKKTFLAFKKWVKNIQTAGYNGAHTVIVFAELKLCGELCVGRYNWVVAYRRVFLYHIA